MHKKTLLPMTAPSTSALSRSSRTWTRRTDRRIKKRGYDINLLRAVIEVLQNGNALPEKYKDHPLRPNWRGYKECHIQSDWHAFRFV